MADFGKLLQSAKLKAQEAIGNAASNIATSTKTKVNEINLNTRRGEIMSSFGEKAYEIWRKGGTFPAELEALLKEVSELDGQLDSIKEERVAAAKAKEEAAAKARAEAEAKKAEQQKPKAPTLVVPEPGDEPAEEAEATVEAVAETVVEEVEEAAEAVAEEIAGEAAEQADDVSYTAAEDEEKKPEEEVTTIE